MLIKTANMAAKRKIDDEIEGYLHNVTPMKIAKNSNKKYFKAVFQDNTSFTDVVCFAPDVQDKMLDLEKQK